MKNGWDDIIAMTTISSNTKQTIDLSFGYSKLLYQGNNSFRSRSPGFLGIVGANNETLTVPLEKGENQILFIVTEQFGVWGFITKFN